MKRNIHLYLILLPTFFFLLLFTYWPLFRALLDSFYDGRSLGELEFVGIDNFIRLFTDPIFWISLKNNLIYILLTVFPSIIIALCLAVFLYENRFINRWLRTIFFLPTIIPLVSAATIWMFIFIPSMGLLDYYLGKFFSPMNNNYLGMSNSALIALSAVGIWKFAGYYMIFFLAGLQAIPESAKEAAIMEGASRRQVFFYITLPLLRPTINFVVIIAFVYSITQIDHIIVMTQGGPNHSTSVLLYYIQDLMLNSHDLGKASAATFITLALLFIFSIINLRVLERGVHYEH